MAAAGWHRVHDAGRKELMQPSRMQQGCCRVGNVCKVVVQCDTSTVWDGYFRVCKVYNGMQHTSNVT